MQTPFYKTGERDMQAPDGFQPQTQQNNGGPKGLGQPARSTPQAQPMAKPGGAQPQPEQPMPGNGQPGNLYGQSAPAHPGADLWANRNSMDPVQLIQMAFLRFQGRAPAPFEVQSLLQSPSTDALVEQLLNLQRPGQPSPVQQAILR